MPHPLAIALTATRDYGAVQKTAELASFLAVLQGVRPLEVIVEIGSDAGGTLWAWQQLGCQVIGVDLPYAAFSSSYPDGLVPVSHELNGHGCEIVIGDSHHWNTYRCLIEVLDGRTVDMLFIDGDHSYPGVKADYEMYSPLVRPGGVIAFHDVCDHPELTGCKVRAFWQSLDGDKEEIVTFPPTWGGIGMLRVPALVTA